MGSVRLHPTRKTLFLDFRIDGKRCREYTALRDTPTNRTKLRRALAKIEAEGSVSESVAAPTADAVPTPPSAPLPPPPATPAFETFAKQWVQEHAVEWRRSHLRTLISTVAGHLNPAFGPQPVGEITREAVLHFRTALAGRPGRRPGSRLSNKRINAVMAVLKQMLGSRTALQVRLAGT